MKSPCLRFLTFLGLAAFSLSNALGALHLSEFVADNGGALRDEDGDASDWIEIFNSGPGDVALDGYQLSDHATEQTSWSFPSMTLEKGDFLIVFASGKDRSEAGSELHTDFQIAKEGGYLALTDPDGSTITAFGAEDNPLPPQLEGVSYGLTQTGDRTSTVFLNENAAGRALVPTNGTLGERWLAPEFEDSSWRAVSMGIGYDENTGYASEFGAGGDFGDTFNGQNTSVYLRVPFEATETSSLSELSLKVKYDDGFAAFLNGVRVANANAPNALTWNSEATAGHPDGEATTLLDFDISEHTQLLTPGTNVLAFQGLNDGLTSSDMLLAAELHGLLVANPTVGSTGFLGRPTPGSLNGESFSGFVGDTKFSIDRGFFEAPFDLVISTDTEGAQIRYTLDGSAPSATQGQLYSTPIRIDSTTVVRALAVREGFRSSNVDTHTYLFPEDVLTQPDMRSVITESANYGPQMIDSLKAVPTFSLVTENVGFENETAGNIRTEHQASMEMIFPDGTPGFQENGGLSNYGGRFTNFRKKSFRVAFREEFGRTKLKYPIFDGFEYSHFPPAEEFDVINLRSGSHDMQSRGAYMSNRFTDDSMLDMGNVAPHGRFVHVYLNGKYWGQYHLRERWSADMAASYFGGPKKDYEAVNANDNFQDDEEVYDGVGDFWNETKGLIAGANPFNNAAEHIDIVNIVDFMLLWVSGNSESEFRSFGSASRGIPFKFMIKDADGYLRGASAGKASHAGPLSVMSRMRQGAGGEEFSILLADRIHEHFFNDGALTPAKNIARLQRRVEEARLGFLSEAARWGNVFRDPLSWESYQNNLITNHFPSLAQTMIGRFRSAGMYPETVAPVYSQHGGSVSTDTPITLATDGDRIYYTLDGSDPRLIGGAPNPDALVVSFGGDGGPGVQPPVTFLTTGNIWRYLDDGSDQGTAWRASNFNDSAWSSGPSQLGYGGADEESGTALSFGGDSSNKFPTTYFRTAVEIPDPEVFLQFLIRIKYDDGVAVYVNGVEAVRANLQENARFDDFAASTVGDEDGWKDFIVPTTTFSAGKNTLAVEIHQGSGTSSDIRLDMLLRGETTIQSSADNVSKPLFLAEPTLLRSRAFKTVSGEWSALNEAFFTIDSVPADATNLVITEFHYHPGEPTKPEELAVTSDRDDFEFLEVMNIAPQAVDLAGVRFKSGIEFTFPQHSVLSGGERVLLVRDRMAYEARYGSLAGIQAFEYRGRLSNDGESLRIAGIGPTPIRDFTYNDQLPWPLEADGDGASLVLISPNNNPAHADAANWTTKQRDGAPTANAITYVQWATSQGLLGGPEADDDGDTLTNFFEYLYGSRATDASDAPIPAIAIQTINVDGSPDDYVTLSFQQNRNAKGATLNVEIAENLIEWTSTPTVTVEWTRTSNDDGTDTVTLRFAEPVRAKDQQRYVRLRGVSP